MVTLAIWGEVTLGAILIKCGLWGDIVDVITCAIFRDCRLRGVGVVRGVSLPSPIDLTRRPYNTGHTVLVTLPCDPVIDLPRNGESWHESPDKTPWDKMSPDKIFPGKVLLGQNATGKIATMTKCHKRVEAKALLADDFYIVSVNFYYDIIFFIIRLNFRNFYCVHSLCL